MSAGGGGLDYEHLRALFMTEALELLTQLERGALLLEARPDDAEQLNEVFRAAHSIKGGASMCGFDAVGRLTHMLETMLDAWREGELTPDARHFAVLLKSADVLRSLIESPDPNVIDTRELDAELSALCAAAPNGEPARAPQPKAAESGQPRRFRIQFAPQPDAFQFGGDPLLALRELKSYAASFKSRLDPLRVPELDQIAPDSAYFGFEIELSLLPDVELQRLHDALSFYDGMATLSIEQLQDDPPPSAAQAVEALAPKPAPDVSADPAGRAPAEASTIRVATEKVDKIIDLMGELVIAHSAVRELVKRTASDHAGALHEAVLLADRHLRELQERVMSVRMVPVSSAFSRLPRMVRDLCKKLDKDVQLELRGTETELDKTLAEKLSDPLGHLVRNAMDHGIEERAARSTAGKSATARVDVSAYARAGSVYIEVQDDGRGLDRERIRATAIQRGLIAAEDVLSDDQVYKLICSPGFSTKAVATDVSGRGVGLDVVQRNLQELGGELEIESEIGVGTCFRLRLPLTLTIIDGLLLAAGQKTCVLPLVDIAYSQRMLPGQVKVLAGAGQVLDTAGEALPLLELAHVLGGPLGDRAPGNLAVIVHSGSFRYALRVDALLGQTQAVVKSLETHYRRVPGIMGATILGDGRVALILDAQGIAQAAGLRRGRTEAKDSRSNEARHALQ